MSQAVSEQDLRKGDHRAYSLPEIVVAYKHIDRVRRALLDLDIDSELVDDHPRLGLGLIRLANDASAAWKLRNHDPDWADKVGATEEPSESDGSAMYLDSFLRGLRRYFATKYAGWKPLVGKNRVVGLVTTTPGTVWHGGGGPLAQADANQTLDPRDGRPQLYGNGVTVGLLDTKIASLDWLAGGWTSDAGDVFQPTKTLEKRRPGGPPPPPLPNGAIGHATFVAGLILDKAPGCVVRAREVLDDEGKAPAWRVATALVELASSKPDIINLSLVCYTEDGEPPLVLATALDRVPADIVVVAAAGNHGDLDAADLELDVESLRQEKAAAGRSPTKQAKLQSRLGLSKAEYKLDPADWIELLVARESRKPGWPAAFERVVAVGSGRAANSPSDFTPKQVGWIDALADGEGPKGKGVVSTYPPGWYSVVQVVQPSSKSKSQTTRAASASSAMKKTVTRKKEFTGGFAVWGGTSFSAASFSGAIAARTEPGEITAREALEQLLPLAKPVSNNRLSEPIADPDDDPDMPTFLPLGNPD